MCACVDDTLVSMKYGRNSWDASSVLGRVDAETNYRCQTTLPRWSEDSWEDTDHRKPTGKFCVEVFFSKSATFQIERMHFSKLSEAWLMLVCLYWLPKSDCWTVDLICHLTQSIKNWTGLGDSSSDEQLFHCMYQTKVLLNKWRETPHASLAENWITAAWTMHWAYNLSNCRNVVNLGDDIWQ